MNSNLKILLVGIIIGIVLALISYFLDNGKNFYIRMLGILIGFALTSVILTGNIF